MSAALKMEHVKQDDFIEKCNMRLRVLEDQLLDAKINEVTPTTATAPLGMGVPPAFIDPATGRPGTPAEQEKSRVEQIEDEIRAVRELRDSYKVK